MKKIKLFSVSIILIVCFPIIAKCSGKVWDTPAEKAVHSPLTNTIIFGIVTAIEKIRIDRTEEQIAEGREFLKWMKVASALDEAPPPKNENDSKTYDFLLETAYVIRYSVRVTEIFKGGNLNVGDVIKMDAIIHHNETTRNIIYEEVLNALNQEGDFFLDDPWGGFEYVGRFYPFESDKAKQSEIEDFRYEFGRHLAIMDLLTNNLDNLNTTGKRELWLRSFRPPIEELDNESTLNSIKNWWTEEKKRYKIYDEYTVDERFKGLLIKETK